eukprot:4115387-Heterocapsa_arctica.AAC.1
MNVYLAGVITNAVRAARSLQPGAAGRGQPVAAHAFPPDPPTLAGAAARSGAPAQAGAAAWPGARGEVKPALRQAGGGNAGLAPTRPNQGGGGSSPPGVASAAASAVTGFVTTAAPAQPVLARAGRWSNALIAPSAMRSAASSADAGGRPPGAKLPRFATFRPEEATWIRPGASAIAAGASAAGAPQSLTPKPAVFRETPLRGPVGPTQKSIDEQKAIGGLRRTACSVAKIPSLVAAGKRIGALAD